MKKKLIVVLLCLVTLIGLYFVLRALVPYNTEKLSSPKILSLDSYCLSWENIYGADGYELDVGGEKIVTQLPEYNLKFSHNGKTVKVRALGDGIRYSDSDYGKSILIVFEKDMLETVSYVNYIVEEAGVRLIEFNYIDEVIDVSPIDLSEYGYNFIRWFRIIDGMTIPVTENFVASGTINLYAEVEAVVYNVTYEFGDFQKPDYIPSTYTVETVASLVEPYSQKEGYEISGWCTDVNGENLLVKHQKITGDLTLYPRISLINEGLIFEKCDGGYALKSYKGEDQVIYVPKLYKGEPVLLVLADAVNGMPTSGQNEFAYDGTNAPFVKEVVFYGDITVREKAFSGCLNFEKCTFYGNAKIEEGAFRFYKTHNTESISFKFLKEPNLNQNFFDFALGLKPDATIQILVTEEYYTATCELFSDGVAVGIV